MWDEVRVLVSEELSALRAEVRDPESDKSLKRLEIITKVLKGIPVSPVEYSSTLDDMSDEEAEEILRDT